MRVMLQNYTTLEYWRGHHGWTKHEHEALDFKTSVAAIEFCVRTRVVDAQVLLRFGEDRFFDIVIPISPAKAGQIRKEHADLIAAA